jgi:serine/threonine protein kinase
MTTTSEHTGTARYLAPELLAEENVYPTTESDVYALGCLGLEVSHMIAAFSP